MMAKALLRIGVILILLLAAGLRFHKLDAQSFWNDEGNSARIAERPINLIVEGAAGDIHPPAYYLILAGWRALTGHSEFALRMFSALAGIVAVAAIYAIGVALFDRASALVGAFIAAISPFQVWYSQEARMYALVAMLAALSIWLTIKVINLPGKMIAKRFNPRQAIVIAGGFILVNTLGLYTHYSFPLILLAESLIFLIWLIRRIIGARGRGASPLRTAIHGLRVWVILNLIPVIFFVPWIPTAVRQISTWPRGSGAGINALKLASTLAYGITLPPDVARNGLIPLALLVLVGCFTPIDFDSEQRRYLRFTERLGLVLAWLIVPVATLIIVGALSEPFLKFLLPSNLALALLVGRGIALGLELGRPVTGTSKLNTAMILITIVGLSIFAGLPLYTSLNNLYGNPAYARDNYRAIAQRIRIESGPDAAVILDAPNQWEVFTYYYPDGDGIAPLPKGETEGRINELLQTHKRIYVLYWGAEQQDPQGIVQHTLEQSAFEAGSEWYGGVRLAIYAVTDGSTGFKTSGAQFGDAIRLEGFTVSAESLHPGDGLGVDLFWRSGVLIDQTLKVFVHLYGPDGALTAQHDSEPVNNQRPTTTWQVGEQIVDRHGLLIPLDAPPGTYHLAVGLYRPEDSTRLPVIVAGQSLSDVATLMHITIK